MTLFLGFLFAFMVVFLNCFSFFATNATLNYSVQKLLCLIAILVIVWKIVIFCNPAEKKIIKCDSYMVSLDTMQRLSAPHSRSGSPMANSRQYYHPGVPAASHVTAGSNHSSRTNSPAFGSTAGSRNGSQTSLTEDSCRKVASQVRFCAISKNRIEMQTL